MLLGTAGQSRELEEKTAALQGIGSFVLMERAGAGVAHVAREMIGGSRDPVVVVSGKGNNGGDGFVVARLLAREGRAVKAYSTCRPEEFRGDAARALQSLPESLKPVPVEDETALQGLVNDFESCGLVVDAIFGSGIRGEIGGWPRRAIEAINRAGRPTLAVDLPSGVEADTGRICGDAVRATATASIDPPKVGLFLFPGAGFAGEIRRVDIGIPVGLAAEVLDTGLAEEADISRLLPRRAPDAHKRACGEVAVVAGSPGMTGAPTLACRAVFRSGAGMVYLLCPEELLPVLATKLTETILLPLPSEEGYLGATAAEPAADLAHRRDVILVGPGLTARLGVRELVHRLLALPNALVVDADALNVLAGQPERLAAREGPTTITPHPGEMGRLLSRSAQEVQADRLGAAREAARKTGAVVILKGARTIVANPEGRATICPWGNAGMAGAGTGDVLAGAVAGLWAQGLSAEDAALLGVSLHALAGDMAAADLTEYALVASDLVDYLPKAFLRLQAHRMPDRRMKESAPAKSL